MKFEIDKSLGLSLLLPLLWLAFLRIVLMPGGENCFDAYYHISMADAGPSAIFSKSFPSMTMSVWETSFSDKEALFHLALWGIRSLQSALGLPMGYPFHFAALIFDAILICVFVLSLRALGVRSTLLPALALVTISPFFANRLLMLRPHVASIILMCAAIPLYAKAKGRWGLFASLAMGMVYSWTYSNPHFILFPAVCMGAARFKEEGFKAALPSVFAGLGVLLAQVIHPQFPNTVINWYIQCVDVVMHSLFPASYPISSPDELKSADVLWAIGNILVYGVFAFNLCLFLAIRARDGLKAIPPAVQGLFAASAIAVAGSLFGIRAMEYGCPFTLMSCATLIGVLNSLPEPLKGFQFSKRAKLEVCAVLIVAAGAGCIMRTGGFLAAPPEGLVAWAAKSGALPPGTKIANLAWSDFPILNYALPGRRYLCGLDPMFAFRRYPERFTAIEQFRMLETWLPPERLAWASESEYAYIRKRDCLLGPAMEIGGYDCVYKGPDGWLFKLPKAPSGALR